MAATLNRVYGIDLGTTYSCIAYVDEHGKSIVVPNAENERITASAVFFDGDAVVVGTIAKESAKLYPTAVVEMVKRSMADPNYLFEHQGKTYRPEEIASFILRKVVQDAAMVTGDTIEDVVITCPAYFGIAQREATAKAGEIAGLNVRSIINEPTAAAIAYGLDRAMDQVVLIYDLGGGTFDITMIEVKARAITVLCTGGDHNLGGKDWDLALVRYLAGEYQVQTGVSEDILDAAETLQDLLIGAERSKKILSQRDKAPMVVTHDGKRAKLELSREKFDELTGPLLDRTIRMTWKMLDEANGKGHSRYDKILLVGGSTRMPQVMQRLKQEFKVDCEIYDPDESVAKGAAIYGWKLALDDEIKITLAGWTGEPADNLDVEQVNPASMAKAQAQVANKFGLSADAVRKAAGTRVINVTSKTFGVVITLSATREEKVSNLIHRNDPVPANVTRDYGTLDDNQLTVAIRLMEGENLGEHSEIADCTEIGNGDLHMPRGLPAGSPISVSFTLNEQGRLEVTATDLTSKKSVRFDVQTAGVMSQEEVDTAKSRALATSVS